MWSLDSFWIQKNSHFLKKQVKNLSLTFIDESAATAGVLAFTWHTYSKDNLSFITFPVSVHQSINDSNCFSKPVTDNFHDRFSVFSPDFSICDNLHSLFICFWTSLQSFFLWTYLCMFTVYNYCLMCRILDMYNTCFERF